MDENSQNQGEIVSPDKRARLMENFVRGSQDRLDNLIMEGRLILKRDLAVDFDRLMTQLGEADKVFGLVDTELPRNYRLRKSTGAAGGYYLQKHGKKVEPMQLAIDIGSGWIEALNAHLDTKLAPKRPKQIEAPKET